MAEFAVEGALALAPEAATLAAEAAPELEVLGTEAVAGAKSLGARAASTAGRLFARAPASALGVVGDTAVATGLTAVASTAAEEAAPRVASEAAQQLAPKAADAAAAQNEALMRRLGDVGLGVGLGYAASPPPAAESSKTNLAANPSTATSPANPGSPVGGGSASYRRDTRGRFVRQKLGGADGEDKFAGDAGRRVRFAEDTKFGDGSVHKPVRGGAPPTVVIHTPRRPLSETVQLAVLTVLIIVVAAAAVATVLKRPSPVTSFWYGLGLGSVTGLAAAWVLSARQARA